MDELHSLSAVKRASTGSKILDVLLEGGLESDVLTTVYGPAGSGKTNICMLTAIDVAKRGKKVVYIDSENGFSVERMKQLDSDYNETLKNFMFLRPSTFRELRKTVEQLGRVVSGQTGLIVIDSMAMLYRLELGKVMDVAGINCEMSHQLSLLTELARVKQIPILLTNQVYADFANRGGVRMVGGDLLRYGSKCLIELVREDSGVRRAVLRKHRSIPEDSEVKIEIVNSGIIEKK